MKEATGELNMTVFVVMVVAALSAFFFTVVWPSISNNMNQNTNCKKAICKSTPNGDGTVDCYLLNKDNVKTAEFTCVWKG